ncbi:hypothetical protein HMPREF3230_00403 [Gardnerella vaginalis]|uniref:Uncharacterized protein n=1 Tax=Gardnerella vaginalis TaxID=2702 RepID=A0A135Z9A8_GARVA|nr:hypothetical protein HMPREF3230_00403 [Gardnerella vaginalis]
MFKSKASLYTTRNEARWERNENRRVKITNIQYIKASQYRFFLV